MRWISSRWRGMLVALPPGCALLLIIVGAGVPSFQEQPKNTQQTGAPSQTQPREEPRPAEPSAQNPTAQTPSSGVAPSGTGASGTTPHPRSAGFFVMIDAGHGGDDRGAQLANGTAEKDVTLAMARRVKAELQDRGIQAHLLRESDYNLSLDQRAEISNEQHASVYLSIHASPPGEGVRIYAPALTSPAPAAAGRFLPWESAQSVHLKRSQALARAVSTELNRRGIPVAMMSVPLRPLNNINAPAIGIELVEGGGGREITSARFQNSVAANVAAGIAQMHSLMAQPQAEGPQ
jgi:N-acetylmuramoyl-L-alanine amidase